MKYTPVTDHRSA